MGAVTADSRRFAATAMGGIAVMMAYQVASRAIRDTLFLSSFAPRTLPLMVAVASVLSIACAIGAARLLSRHGPARVVPGALALSGLLTLAEWLLASLRPAAGAVVVYLHVSAIAPVLLSGFWSILNERFDPRTAKRVIGRVSAVGTLGGLAGGVLAERAASWLGVPGTLGLLALLQVWCAWSLWGLAAQAGRHAHAHAREPRGHVPVAQAMKQLAGTSYLRNLALLILGSSVSASLLDYVFKAQSAGAMSPGLGLMRLFAAFYAVVSLLTFTIQALFTRIALGRAGVAPSIGALPGAVVVGGAVAALVPGPWSVAFARGLEAVLRGSLFRSGYELLYTPIPAAEKRATKALVDVGCDRLGDMVGAGLVALVLVLPASTTNTALIALAVAFALATLALVARLQSGYVSSLEAGLRARAIAPDSIALPDWSVAQSLTGSFGIPGLPAAQGAKADTPVPVAEAKPAAAPPRFDAPADDALTASLRELRSGDPARVRAALAAGSPLDPGLVAQGIVLLAWDEVASDAIRALRAVATRHAGQLVDALLDPGTEFTVRRRIPTVLAVSHAPRAVDGLVNGLVDTRFEVRYRCGRALDGLRGADPRLGVDELLVFEAVRRETRVGRAVWNSQKLLEQLEETGHETFVDDFVRHRAGRSLEHVFTLLALVLPREPLRIAFSGLNAGNPSLRGLALEYLESVLPPDVRDELWPYLEERPRSPGEAAHRARDRGEVLDDLMRSNLSIQLGLEKLRQAHQPDPDSVSS